MLHQEIKKFTYEGVIGDKNMVEYKERLIFNLEGNMRDEGYVPVLDIDPQFSLDFRPEHNDFRFELTVYGVEIGKEDAWQVSGIMNGKKVQSYTPNPPSKQSSTMRE